MTKQKIRVGLGIATAVSLPIAGAALWAGCLQLYRADSFTPQAVAETFSRLSLPVWLCLALAAVSLIARPFLGAAKEPPMEKALPLLLQTLRARRDADGLRPQLARLEKRRGIYRSLTWVLGAVCMAVALAYWANPANFHSQDISLSMARAMAVLAPCLGLWGGWAVAAQYLDRKNMARQIDLLRAAPKAERAAPSPAPAAVRRWPLQGAVLALAVGCLVFGALTGGTVDVLTKAVNICTECVGLG